MTLAARVQALRGDMTQGELAKKAGLSIATINHIETKKQKRPTLETITRLAKALGVKPAELI